MYIWVILAFFITALYSYNLSFRADLREVTVSPRAQSVASKVVIQHEAASRWVRDHSLGGDSNATVPPGNLQNMFNTQEVPIIELEFYLPFGYQADYGPKYRSYIYCLNKRNLSELAPSDYGCNSEFSVAYLITYGCVARKWISLTTGKPNKDLEFGISEAKKLGAEMGYTEDFSGLDVDEKAERLSIKPYAAIAYEGDGEGNATGVVDYNDLGENDEWGSYDPDYSKTYRRYIGDYYIMRGRAEPSPIPKYISNFGEEDGGFRKVCVTDEGCPFCLAYITSFE